MGEFKKENGEGKNNSNCCCQNENEKNQSGTQNRNEKNQNGTQNGSGNKRNYSQNAQSERENCDCNKQSERENNGLNGLNANGWQDIRYGQSGMENRAKNKRSFCQGLIASETCDCEREREDARSERLENLMRNCEQSTAEQPEIGLEELQEIYRNASVGRESVDILRPISEDRGFRNLLLKQYKAYSAIAKEIELYAANFGIELSPPSVFAKGMMFFTATVNTVKNKSNSKLAEIMIQGINMGVISMTKLINKLSDEGKTTPYANDMLIILQRNLEEMKLFL